MEEENVDYGESLFQYRAFKTVIKLLLQTPSISDSRCCGKFGQISQVYFGSFQRVKAFVHWSGDTQGVRLGLQKTQVCFGLWHINSGTSPNPIPIVPNDPGSIVKNVIVKKVEEKHGADLHYGLAL
jgi:hypothetical protein